MTYCDPSNLTAAANTPIPAKVAFLGGDTREVMVMEAMLRQGWQVAAYGRPATKLPKGVEFCTQGAQALTGATAVILPAPPLRDGGRLYNAEGLELTVALEHFCN